MKNIATSDTMNIILRSIRDGLSVAISILGIVIMTLGTIGLGYWGGIKLLVGLILGLVIMAVAVYSKNIYIRSVVDYINESKINER